MSLGENGMALLAFALMVLLLMPVVLIAKLPKQATVWIALVWLFMPIPAYWILIAAERLVRPEDPAHSMDNAWIGFYLLSGVLAVPWLVMWGGGIALGIALRKGRNRAVLAAPSRSGQAVAVASSAPPVSHSPVPIPGPDAATKVLHNRIRAQAAQLGVEERVLPINYVPDNGTVYVFVGEFGYCMARYDRGQEYDVSSTESLDEILYWVFDEATFRLASEHAARTLTHADQLGPLVLQSQESLLADINPEWHRRWQNDPSRRAAHYRERAER